MRRRQLVLCVVSQICWMAPDPWMSASVRTSPGRATLLDYTVVNTGNVEGDFSFAADAPAGWSVNFTPPVQHLAPGDKARVVAVLNASRAAPDGRTSIDITATLDGAARSAAPLAVTLARPQLALESVSATGRPANGELVLVTASISNRGGIDAQNVTVALLVDGKPVDSVTQARVPVNSTQLATLSWAATSSSKDVKVVLDPANEIVQSEGGKASADVAFASRSPIPIPGVGALLAVVAGVALLLGTGAKEQRSRLLSSLAPVKGAKSRGGRKP